MDFLDFLYDVRSDDSEPFGERWIGPEVYEPWDDHVVAEYAGQGDGYDVQVLASAAPARFWKIVALPSENSVGTPMSGFTLSTGSGGKEMAEWVNNTAEMIAEGMLGHRLPESPALDKLESAIKTWEGEAETSYHVTSFLKAVARHLRAEREELES